MKYIASTEQKLKGLVTKEVASRFFASLLVALSGLLLYLDKVIVFFDVTGGNSYGFADFETFIWVFTQSAAPVLMIIAYPFKPYISSFVIPVYCYAIQIIWIFQPQFTFDHLYLQLYAIGSCLLFIILLIFIKFIGRWNRKRNDLKLEFQKEKEQIVTILKSKTLSET